MKKIKAWIYSIFYRYFEVVEIDEDGHIIEKKQQDE